MRYLSDRMGGSEALQDHVETHSLGGMQEGSTEQRKPRSGASPRTNVNLSGRQGQREPESSSAPQRGGMTAGSVLGITRSQSLVQGGGGRSVQGKGRRLGPRGRWSTEHGFYSREQDITDTCKKGSDRTTFVFYIAFNPSCHVYYYSIFFRI